MEKNKIRNKGKPKQWRDIKGIALHIRFRNRWNVLHNNMFTDMTTFVLVWPLQRFENYVSTNWTNFDMFSLYTPLVFIDITTTFPHAKPIYNIECGFTCQSDITLNYCPSHICAFHSMKFLIYFIENAHQAFIIANTMCGLL